MRLLGSESKNGRTGVLKFFHSILFSPSRNCRTVRRYRVNTEEIGMSLTRKAALAGILGIIALRAEAVVADTPAAPKTDVQTQEKTAEKRKTLMADATAALSETQNALHLLDAGKQKEALAALERASGKLDIILARDSSLTLAPTGVTVITTDLQGGPALAKQLRQDAEDLLTEGRVQEARRVLRTLASETVVSVSNLPLATYPAAIKEAVKAIDANKPEVAKSILQTALNTQVITDTVIPLPVVSARESLKVAEGLSEKKDRTADDNARLKAALGHARERLEFAQVLGYGAKKDFDTLYKQLSEVEQKTADNKSGTGWYAKLKASISDLMKSSEHAK
jgi:YfdX protein